jgi:DNA polymerase-1
MRFEDYLLLVRDGLLDQKDTSAARKSKLIGQEIEAAEKLREWVKSHGGLRLIQTPEEALEVLSKFDSGVVTGVDIETAKASEHPKAGLLPEVSLIRLVQLWQPRQPVLVVDCYKAGYEWLGALTPMRLVAHNALFEIKHLRRVMPQVPEITCSMLMMRPFAGKNLSLVKTMREVGDMLVDVDASDALDIELSKALQVSDWSRAELVEEQIYYAAADAIAACLLHERLTTIYESSDIEYSHANGLLQRMVRVVANQAPICLNRPEHAKVMAQWEADIAEAREALSAQGLSKPQSVPAKQAWLAEMLSAEDLLDWPLTLTGNLSTSADVILQRDLPQLKTLTTFTRTSSLSANFGRKLANVAVADALHPNYKIAAAATGRFACSEPNLQNIPKELRHLFTAPVGWKLVTGDLSQIELRVAGILSDEGVINQAYRDGEDLHRLMGAKLAGIPVDQVTKKERQQAKAANFGLLFGAGAKTLKEYASRAYGVEMDSTTAQETKRAFHGMYPSLTQWQQRIVAETNLLGYSQSHHYKLRRHYSEEVYTHAMNFPVQSTAAEILMTAMMYIDARLPNDGSIRICLTVYDELMLIARDELVDAAALLLRDGFKHGFLTVFPDGATNGLVGIGSGQNWAEAAEDNSVRQEWSL